MRTKISKPEPEIMVERTIEIPGYPLRLEIGRNMVTSKRFAWAINTKGGQARMWSLGADGTWSPFYPQTPESWPALDEAVLPLLPALDASCGWQ